MGILPDWMIQRDVKIEPFEPAQSRPGVISYGVTSYGYDVRVGRKFKIFHNALCTVVDPKQFDPRSFIDIEADSCLIPPNSFALAETVEYFDIPRDILCVCLGKSTYARCFTGRTRVALVDGTAPTLEDMARRWDDGETFWGYGIGPTGRLIVTALEAPRYIGRDALVEVTIDDGKTIHCTPDHKFLLRDGGSREAAQLRPGDALMPLYRDSIAGTEIVYEPRSGRYESTARLVAESATRRGGAAENPGGFSAGAAAPNVAQRNHRVASVREQRGIHDVYCLTVPEAGNFALEAGVFVHNCGIIVNVTPLEPEWKGKITIEISNTTPLPAKIYAGEGIAQILFFRGEAVCKLSYADKKGKYQNQKGLTLPFVEGQVPPASEQ